MTTTHTPIPATDRTRLDFSDRSIAILVGVAVAIVGVNRPAVAGLPPTVLLVVAAFAWAMLLPRVPGAPGARLTTVDAAVVAWFGAKIAVEYYNSGQGRIPFELGSVLDPILALMVVAIVKRRFGTESRAVGFARCLVVPAVGVSVLAVLQVLDRFGVNEALASVMGGSALQARIDNGWDIRGTATIGHWTALGGYLCVCIAVCSMLLLRARARREPVRAWAIALGVLVVGQVTTFTFATIAVTVVILLPVLYVVRPKPHRVLAGLAVLGGLWWAFSATLTERVDKQLTTDPRSPTLLPESVAFRANVWTHETIPAIGDSPILGHGLGVYKYVGTGRVPSVLSWHSPESEWMRTAVSSGVVVLALEVLALLAVLAFLWRAARDRALAPLFAMAAAMVTVMCIHSHLADRAFLLSFWAAVAVAQIVAHPTRSPR